MVKVFINHIDKYTGKIIGKVLGEAVVGGTRDETGEDDEDEGENQEGGATATTVANYEVIGTISDPKAEQPQWAKEIVQPLDRDNLSSILLNCDIIIYYIGECDEAVEEASWAMQILHDNMSLFTTQKMFICISTVLTWARTKPLNPDEPDVPFTEEEYRRRRTHPNFKNHITAEKLLIKLGKTDKSKFLTYVVSSGLQYGGEQNIFHFLFKNAWLGNEPFLPIFGDGQNIIPMIHTYDLASIILNITDNKPKTKYIIAVDDSQNIQEEIVKAISKGLGNGRTKYTPKEEALLLKDLSQCHYDHLLVNLQVEGTCVKETMRFDWKAETGLVENIDDVIKEFKETRGLLPIRLCILGPPAVGKTTVASQICQYYKLHHLKLGDVIREAIEKLEKTSARSDQDDEDEDGDDTAQQAKDYLDVLKDDKNENDGQYSTQYSTQHILEFYKQKLKSMPCQNQGFVLDGFPKTEEEAKELFAPNDTEDDDDNQQEAYNKMIMPELVISLEASNEYLKERVMNLPQNEVFETHNTEEGLLRRLRLFRERNEEDVTVLNYFDEFEIHPLSIKVEEDHSPKFLSTVETLKKKIGEPRNYGPTPEERARMEERAREEKLIQETEEQEEIERQEKLEKELREKRETEWSERLAQVQQEEQEMLETQSIPLRNYLMRHVLPTLTDGLMEVCKVRPDDPVDYLAEYLFNKNPQMD